MDFGTNSKLQVHSPVQFGIRTTHPPTPAGNDGLIYYNEAEHKLYSYIDENTKVKKANDVTLNITSLRDISSQAKGGQGGLVVAGASVSDVDMGGEFISYVNNYAEIGKDDFVNSLSVNTECTDKAVSKSYAGEAGIVAGRPAPPRVGPASRERNGRGGW